MARHPMRFAQGVDGVAIQIGDGFAHDFVCSAAVKFHVARQGNGICAGLGQGFADILCLEFRQLVDMVQDPLANTR